MDTFSYLLGKSKGGGGPSPSGTIEITSNGIYDVTSKATANVNVSSGGGDLSQYFDTEIKSNTNYNNYLFVQDIVKKIPPLTLNENVTNLTYAFAYFPNIELDFSQFDTKNVAIFEGMFRSSNLEKIDISNFDTSNVTNFKKPFENCSKLKELICNNLKLKTQYVSLDNLFKDLTKLAKLDISQFDLNDNPSYYLSNMFTNCGTSCLQSDGAYADGIPYVYVKNASAQNWVLNTSGNGHPDTWTTANVVIKS